MSSQAIVLGLLAAVLLFWAVGAYNRLVSLRNTLLRHFAAVDEQFRSRHALLLQWADTLTGADAALLDSLRAACQQAEAACTHARSRASNAGALTSLRLAEEILVAGPRAAAGARGRRRSAGGAGRRARRGRHHAGLRAAAVQRGGAGLQPCGRPVPHLGDCRDVRLPQGEHTLTMVRQLP